MSGYNRPGVFVNESLTQYSAGPAGVTGDAVACFVAAYNRGPTQPTLVRSWQNYTNLYGDFSVANGSPLAYAVWSYFQNGGSACYVYRVPNTDAVVADLVIGSTEPTQASLTPPSAPVPTTLGTGGTIAAGTYQVEVTYVDTYGETTASASGQVTTTGTTSTITIPSPAAQTGATGWYAYVTQVGGSTFTRQQTTGTSGPGGGPTPLVLGTPLTLTAPPSSNGAAPPSSNTTASNTPKNSSLLTLVANAPGAYGNQLYAEITAGSTTAGDTTSVFNLNIYQGGTTSKYLVESWPGVSLNPDRKSVV